MLCNVGWYRELAVFNSSPCTKKPRRVFLFSTVVPSVVLQLIFVIILKNSD